MSASGATTAGGGSANPMEPFLLLAKSAKGQAMAALIQQVLESPGIYVFGELLEMPNVKELAGGPQASSLELLNHFAYGTYSGYKAKAASLPQLTPAMLLKLRHLSIVSLASDSKRLMYDTLLQELDISNVRELEDLIIEAIYNGVVRAKLDQKNRLLEVEYAIGRDIQQADIDKMIAVLGSWCDGCETMLTTIEQRISAANLAKTEHVLQQEEQEKEIAQLKKALVAASDSPQLDSFFPGGQAFQKGSASKRGRMGNKLGGFRK